MKKLSVLSLSGFSGGAAFLWALMIGSFAPAAQAEITSAFGDQLTCSVDAEGIRVCSGIVLLPNQQDVGGLAPTVPIDVNLFIPAEPLEGDDGNFPIIGEFHGWGGSKLGRGSANRFLNQGYAYLSMSDRGWGNSCGGFDPKRVQGTACQHGYNHLMDTRFEVHDGQTLFGMLADETIINPDQIGVTGSSYGGGISLAMATLNDRQMPVDYEIGDALIPWVSPINAIPLRIAAAAPDITWSDLAYSLQPNGATLDYALDAPYRRPDGAGRIGIMKQSFVSGFYAIGQATSNYAPAGTDPDADLVTWFSLINGGEPYDNNPQAADIIDELTTHHSSYYIDDSVKPAPLFMSNGFTDDIFPPDEAIRFYNRTISTYPDANFQLFFSDHGHQRGQNKSAEVDDRQARRDTWLAYFVKGQGDLPPNQVTVWTQECGDESQGPFSAATWADLPQSELALVTDPDATALLIASEASDTDSGQAYDPIAGGGACATASGADKEGYASYRLPAAPAGGFTLAGSPTVIADVLNPGPNSQIAARLVDIDPESGEAILVARGLFRPDVTLSPEAVRMVFQMHPNAYRFEEGHIAKLELMPNDKPYGRVSNGQAAITISNLDFRLPILEAVGTAGSTDFAPKFLPADYELAPDYVAPVDSDGDGIADEDDACPDDAGAASTDPLFNGCPLPPEDRDNDTVADDNDACPDDPGPVSNGGCPVTDQDGDGVDDADDTCPSDAGPSATSGCPDEDGDLVADFEDDCPSDAGPVSNNGCPEDPGPDTAGTVSNPAANPQPVALMAGESGVIGTLTLSNLEAETHFVHSVSVNLDNPEPLSQLRLTGPAAQVFTCSPATPGTENICVTTTPVSIPAGTSVTLDVRVTASSSSVAMTNAMPNPSKPAALPELALVSLGSGMGFLLVMGGGIRRRYALLLAVVITGLAGCGGGSGTDLNDTAPVDPVVSSSTAALQSVEVRDASDQLKDYGVTPGDITIGTAEVTQ